MGPGAVSDNEQVSYKPHNLETHLRKIIPAAIAAALGLVATPAFCENWYIGGGVGQGHFDMSGQELTGLSDASVNKTDTTFTVRGGYMFNPYFGLDVGYYDLGSYGFNGTGPGHVAVSGSGKAKAWGVSALGVLPLGDMFDVYGRIGYADSQIKTNANTELLTASSTDWQGGATYGVGGHWNFNKSVGLFAEWMKNDKIKVDSYLIGVDFRF